MIALSRGSDSIVGPVLFEREDSVCVARGEPSWPEVSDSFPGDGDNGCPGLLVPPPLPPDAGFALRVSKPLRIEARPRVTNSRSRSWIRRSSTEAYFSLNTIVCMLSPDSSFASVAVTKFTYSRGPVTITVSSSGTEPHPKRGVIRPISISACLRLSAEPGATRIR